MIDIPFDQYQRYKNAQLIINKIRKENKKFKILEVGANEHKNLEKFLPNDSVTYLDISLSDKLLNDPQYVLGDATAMDFEDNSYDIVVALDVYEHIPRDKRKDFITEINRVSKYIAIISAPFNKPEVVNSEIRLNNYFKVLTGIDHKWLIEHIENKLPSLQELYGFLGCNNISYEHFSHGRLNLWEKLTSMHLITVVFNELIDYKQTIDDYYNEFIFQKDYEKENGYRDFFILKKSIKETNFNIDYDINDDNRILEIEKNFFNLLFLKKIRNIDFQLDRKEDCNVIQDTSSIKIYIDYGQGFNEENVIRFSFTEKVKKIVLENLNNKPIINIRIDPTENPGKFTFKDLKIINKKDEIINYVKLTDNSKLKEDQIYYFCENDPNLIMSFNNELIKRFEITIEKLDLEYGKSSVLDEVLLRYNEKLIEKDNELQKIKKDLEEQKQKISIKNIAKKFLKSER